MKKTLQISDVFQSNKIGKTLLLHIFVLSTIVTIFTTSIQVYVGYQSDIDRVTLLGQQIRVGYMKALSTASWNLNLNQINSTLEGLVSLPEVNYASVSLYGDKIAERGHRTDDLHRFNSWEIVYLNKDQWVPLGFFEVEISTQAIYESLLENIITILLLNFVRTIIVATLFLMIVHYLITRHLVNIYQSLENVDVDGGFNAIHLAGSRDEVNELTFVAKAINDLFDKLKESWERLKKSETNYCQLLDCSNNGIIILSESKVFFHNKQFSRFFGVSSDDDIDFQYFSKFLSKNQQGEEANIEALNLDVDGEMKMLQCHNSPVIWDEKKATLLFFIDMTKQERLERKSKKMEASLIQGDRINSLGVMASSITHEVNNQVQLVRMNMTFLKECWGGISIALNAHYKNSDVVTNLPYEELREALPLSIQDSIEATFTIENTIAGLRNFVFLGEDPKMIPCEINTILQNVIKITDLYASRYSVYLNSSLDRTHSIYVCGSEPLLNQLFIVLLLNAIEACGSKGGRVKIVTTLTEKCITIKIEDNGVGVLESDRKKIFDLFYSTKEKTGGAGIGLAIADNIINQHKGSIHVKNAAIQGTVFEVEIPLHI